MTRLPPSGAASFALQEGVPQKGAPRVPTIEELLVDLKLKPMSSEKVAEIRGRLRIVVGSWWQEIGQFIGSDGGLDVESVVASLMKAAQGLEEANAVLQAIEGGVQRAENIEAVSRIKKVLSLQQRAANIEAASQIKIALSLHPAIGKSSNPENYISFACEIAETISHACRVAAQMLRSEERKRGRPAHHWYKDFTKILCDIARENRIKATLETDRRTRKPKGRFLELAEGFERLFPREMRSPSREALAKRLSGPLRQIRTASAKGQRDK